MSNNKSPVTALYRFALVAAAALAVVLVFSIAYVRKHFDPSVQHTRNADTVASRPLDSTSHKAVLFLAAGGAIDLDTARNGLLVRQDGVEVSKPESGLLVLRGQGPESPQEGDAGRAHNSLRTPVGGQFRMVLPDGTNVWLNATSHLDFPLAFNRVQRRVVLSGEAYFEVRPDGPRPFVVVVRDHQGVLVEHILTGAAHFNVAAYPDEPVVVTTVLAGELRARHRMGPGSTKKGGDTSGLRLTEGKAAWMSRQDAIVRTGLADTATVLAWKEGRFAFGGAGIGAVMRQLARWYGISLHYQDTLSTQFSGTISRQAPLAEVLKILALSGAVHFSVRGNAVVVSR